MHLIGPLIEFYFLSHEIARALCENTHKSHLGYVEHLIVKTLECQFESIHIRRSEDHKAVAILESMDRFLIDLTKID